ncbi:MAG TPA: putative toxin-antitoxin system toxin component, PIN family [Candidatus Brocadiia bacterium]|nr:putative toxin-antitoxin system toxin component, PIN family [Candidatus Brocadiia bacterium]
MKVVVDTNVFLSGVFFSGPPAQVLRAWKNGTIELVVSPDILTEYRTAGEALEQARPGVALAPWVDLVAMLATVVAAPVLPRQVCDDPDDDKFIACAIASRDALICTGDKALLRVSGHGGVEIVTPRELMRRLFAAR